MGYGHQVPLPIHLLEGLPADLPIQDLMRRLAADQQRTDRIVAEALKAWQEGRKLLLLSERTDHITAIAAALAGQVSNLFLLHGRLHRQQTGKTSARIIDWLDLGHPVLQRMWERRLRGYRAMGYALISPQ